MQTFIGPFGKYALFIKQRKDAASVFNEFAHRKVVMILDHLPFNALLSVLLLLGTKCQLNEELVQFLINIIDAQLFESVNPKNLKSWIKPNT